MLSARDWNIDDHLGCKLIIVKKTPSFNVMYEKDTGRVQLATSHTCNSKKRKCDITLQHVVVLSAHAQNRVTYELSHLPRSFSAKLIQIKGGNFGDLA